MSEGSGSRSGHVRKNLKGDLEYLSFVPADLQEIRIAYSDDLVSLLGKAHRELGRLQEKWESLDDKEKEEKQAQLIRREAENSMRLALDTREEETMQSGTSPLTGLLSIDLNHWEENKSDPPLKGDAAQDLSWLEGAYSYAVSRMEELPLSLRLIRELHDYVMHAEHNYDTKPGEFRYSAVWIGRPGSTPKTAAFVPPIPEDMRKGLGRLEEYINEEGGPDPLIRAALIHSQFEILHPFVDGNGRAGRVLTQLYLLDQKLIPSPILQLSAVLRKREFWYYRTFSMIEEDGDYEGVIRFWLNIVLDACRESISLL